MFDTIELDKNKFQCSSEFGLYRYDSENDYYSIKNKKIGFGFHYLVVLLTSVIVLSMICLVTYNYVSESKSKPILKFNISNVNQSINLTDHKEPTPNFTIISTSSSPTSVSLDYPEPLALELRNSKSDDPRPFIYENRDPKPSGFQYTTGGDQNTQAQMVSPHKHRVKNIQEIIKLLEQSQEEGTIKKNKKKHFRRRGNNNLSYIQDPFFPYKPQNPSDVNLLATNSFRFAPSVQMGVKRTPSSIEQYPKYEKPQNNEQEVPLTLTLDLQNNQQYVKRNKKQKPINYNNLYNHNNYFNPNINRFQQNRIQPYWNRPYVNVANLNPKNIPQNHPMIVHLNLYPKKKKKIHKDQRISESNIQNCTDTWDEDERYSQIKNTSEFNQLLEKVRHSYLDHSNDKVTIKDDKEHLYRIKNTFLQLDQPEPDKMNEFKYSPNDNSENIDIQKSIGFTVINPNFSTSNEHSFESKWRPIIVDNNGDNDSNHDNYDLEVGEANDNIGEGRHESVTLPVPYDIFQKYFNTKPTKKYNDWDLDTVQNNPNLVNHRPSFEDGRDE